MIHILQMMSSIDPHVIPNPAVLVDDGIPDITAMPDTHGGKAMRSCLIDLLDGLIIIHSHQIAAHDGRARPDARTYPDHTILYTGCIDDTPFRDDGLFQGRTADLCR